MTIVRRLRGVVGTALVWAVAWPIVLSPLLLSYWLDARRSAFERPPVWYLGVLFLTLALWGLISGAAFALLMAALGRRGGWARLSITRVACWGFLGGTIIPLCLGVVWMRDPYAAEIFVPWLVLSLVSGTLGGVLAAGTLLLARRSASR